MKSWQRILLEGVYLTSHLRSETKLLDRKSLLNVVELFQRYLSMPSQI